MSRYLPIFPLGNVVMPTQLLPLHIFEPRYRLLMQTLTEPGAPAEMGTVLIERGSEVGGGDVRVGTGTVVHLIESEELPDGRWVAVFAGSHRFRVDTWQEDDPFPRAAVHDLADPDWDEDWNPLLAGAETVVRGALELASELGDGGLRPGFPLAEERTIAAWQLCAAAPLSAFDRQRVLEAVDPPERMRLLAEATADIAKVLAFRLHGG